MANHFENDKNLTTPSHHTNTSASNPAIYFKTTSIIALFVIAVLAITNQTVNYNILQNYITESNIISIAGRQRVLCQRITKDIMIIANQAQISADSSAISKKYKNDLINNVKIWEKSHYALQAGDDELGVPEHHHSENLKKLFHQINPHFDNMYRLSFNFVEYKFSKEITQKTIDEILKHESVFLEIMDNIVKEYGKEIMQKLQHLKTIQLIMFLIMMIVLIVEGVFIFKPMVKKIENYFLKNNKIKAELELAYQESISTQEELKQSNEELNVINESLEKSKLDATTALQELSDNLKYAQYIQRAFLPNQNVVLSQFAGGFIFNRPRNIVSGDFYWYTIINEIKVVCVGDCTGHGVSGSLMTMVCMALLNEIVNEKRCTSPSEILKQLDLHITETLQSQQNHENRVNDGLEGVIIAFDEKNQSVAFAGAKSSLYVANAKKGELIELRGSRYPVGSFEYAGMKSYTEERIEVMPNDWIFLSSDGFKDQIGYVNKKKYLGHNFKRLLKDIAMMPTGMQSEALDREFKHWCRSEAQTDDILIMGLKV